MALTRNHAETLSDRDFFFAALKNYIGEVLFYGICAVIIFFAIKLNWWLGLILFLPYCALSVVSFVQTVTLVPRTVANTITYFHLRKYGTDEEKAIILGEQKPSDQMYSFLTLIIS